MIYQKYTNKIFPLEAPAFKVAKNLEDCLKTHCCTE